MLRESGKPAFDHSRSSLHLFADISLKLLPTTITDLGFHPFASLLITLAVLDDRSPIGGYIGFKRICNDFTHDMPQQSCWKVLVFVQSQERGSSDDLA